MKKILFKNKLVEEFELTDAFCWEGHAGAAVDEVQRDLFIIRVRGSSTVEHEGDEDGIRSQVKDLIGMKAGFDFDGNKYSAKITDAFCSITSIDRIDDGDYTVYVDGKVKILIKQL